MHLWVSISFLSQLQSNSHGGRTYQPEVRSLYCTGSALIYLADFLPGAAASLRAAPPSADLCTVLYCTVQCTDFI